MRIVDLKEPNNAFPGAPCGLVLGNFDGVHLGHIALIEELKRQNAMRDEPLPIGAFCFEAHPFHYFGKPISLLCNNEEKMELFRRAGLQFVIFEDFAALKDLSPEEYVIEFLAKKCQCHVAVCGFNHSFGKKGAGKPSDLVRYLSEYENRSAVVVPPVTDGDISVSSSAIRNMLECGRPEDAARLLGRPYAIEGTAYAVNEDASGLAFRIFVPSDRVIPAEGGYEARLAVEGAETVSVLGISRVRGSSGIEMICKVDEPGFALKTDRKRIKIQFLRRSV